MTAIERLATVTLQTNMKTANKIVDKGFSIFNSWDIVRDQLTNRMESIKVELAEWLWTELTLNNTLTLNNDYFTLTKPLEKRLYLLARKYCGKKKSACVSLDRLHRQSGSRI